MSKPIKCPKELFEKDLSNQIILITGGYSGLGLFTAKQLISQKANVIIAGRNVQKGQRVASDINATFMQLDLSHVESVKKFASDFNSKFKNLNVLFCNAGVMAPGPPDKTPSSKRTKEGWEIQMATNYLGHALLINLLEDKIKTTPSSRIVSVSSCSADSLPLAGQKNQADIDFSDPHWKTRKYNPMDAYGQSKLSQILHARELANRLKDTDTTIVSIHPGWGISTELDRHQPWDLKKVIGPIFGSFMGAMSLEDASQVHLYCALSDKIENGKFYSQIGVYGNKEMQNGGLPMNFISPNATKEKQKKLWDWTMDELKLS